MQLASAVVASHSLTQEMTGSNPFTVMTNIFAKKRNATRKLLAGVISN